MPLACSLSRNILVSGRQNSTTNILPFLQKHLYFMQLCTEDSMLSILHNKLEIFRKYSSMGALEGVMLSNLRKVC